MEGRLLILGCIRACGLNSSNALRIALISLSEFIEDPSPVCS
jgi:hypothetical protein